MISLIFAGYMIVDKYNRVHDYLRISLTDKCNLNCFYCMPDTDYPFAPSASIMRAGEILAISGVFVREGVKKIRLTGGEPLVRKDAAEVILSLSRLPVELSLTTNGTRVHEFLPVLEEAKIKAINISLDTLDEDKFALITRRNLFRQVRDNIEVLIAKGFYVKVNVVLMKGVNDHEINDFVAWTKYSPVHVRFIEFMPFNGNNWTNNQVVSLEEIITSIGTRYTFDPVPGKANDTAKVYAATEHAGTFGVISTMTSPFCSGCNRMRLTADGKLKNCLFSRGETDLLQPLRRGEDITPLIHRGIMAKEKELGGQFSTTLDTLGSLTLENRSMISIGG